MSATWDAVKFSREFPALARKAGGRKLVYLDNACSLLKSASAARAADALLLGAGSCAGARSVHPLAAETEAAFRMARETVAGFIGAPSPANIIFCGGTTDAANLVAQSLRLPKGRNEVIVTGLEHNAIFLPFYRLARAGFIKLKVAPLKNLGVDLPALAKMVTSKTALVAASRASNALGGVTPAAEIAAMARKKGALTFFDSAQYVPSHREDVSALGCSMLAFSGHKIGAQYGTGALYLSDDAMNFMDSARVGGGTVKSVKKGGAGWKVVPAGGYLAFEAGVQNYSGAVSLAAACELLQNRIGYDLIRARVADIVSYAAQRLASTPGLELSVAANPERGSIISLSLTGGASMPDFCLFLNHEYSRAAIALRAGEHCAHVALAEAGLPPLLRLSFWAYNTREDVDAFREAWLAYRRRLK